jgi:hypothetical protein
MIFHCLLAVISLCGALRDRPVLALTATHAAIASWDWTVTREGVNAGAHEADPLARPFVHSNGAMIAGEALEVSLTAMIAERARKSRHRVIRDTWWVWQAVPIAAHVWGARSWRGFHMEAAK